MRVLAFGTYDVSRHPRVGVLVAGLRDRGVEVEEVVRPLGLSTAERVRMLQQPWRLPLLVVRLLRCWTSILVRGVRAVRRSPVDAVLVGYLGHFDVVLARLAFPRTTVVLDHLVFAGDTARDRGAGAGLRGRLLDGLDRLALACADVVVVDTEEHAALVPSRRREDTVVCPVGADVSWFEAQQAAPAPRADRPLRAVFFGLHTPLQGTVTIAQALALLADRPDIEVTMAGSGQDFERAHALGRANPHVTWHEWIPAHELPALVAAHDVCLGIFGTGPKSRRVVPNKAYQGAAAGCVVVTGDTPPQRRALGSAGVFVEAGDAAALAVALRRLADDRAATAELRTASAARAREMFSPRAVTAPLQQALARRHPPSTSLQEHR
ncbi:glycosyltransferase [Blastococcus jejuensis]|uniref:Glycosyltransferase n=1 Tax=Blastococcus jejuensis TaxID=351224 RepID=A0ABP6NNH7_9ACTN